MALAIRDAFPNVKEVIADVETIHMDGIEYSTPERARRFMDRFDYTTNRESISGFTFALEREAPVYWRHK